MGNSILVGRCLSCKNWVNDDYLLEGYSYNYKICNKAKVEDSDGFMDAVCISEGVTGTFITRDDFGCVLYNSR